MTDNRCNPDLSKLSATLVQQQREIERLTAERDEARRIACAYVSGIYRKDMITLDRAACLAEAERRGWDCFNDQADSK
jgi:hypothetical protein